MTSTRIYSIVTSLLSKNSPTLPSFQIIQRPSGVHLPSDRVAEPESRCPGAVASSRPRERRTQRNPLSKKNILYTRRCLNETLPPTERRKRASGQRRGGVRRRQREGGRGGSGVGSPVKRDNTITTKLSQHIRRCKSRRSRACVPTPACTGGRSRKKTRRKERQGRNEKRRIEKTAKIEKAWKHRRRGKGGAGGKKTEGAG